MSGKAQRARPPLFPHGPQRQKLNTSPISQTQRRSADHVFSWPALRFLRCITENFFDWRKRPAEYIRKYRLTQAAKQLRSGDTRVIDAAYDAGVSNVDTFTRAFCREFGLNPGEYRKRPVPVPFFIP